MCSDVNRLENFIGIYTCINIGIYADVNVTVRSFDVLIVCPCVLLYIVKKTKKKTRMISRSYMQSADRGRCAMLRFSRRGT